MKNQTMSRALFALTTFMMTTASLSMLVGCGKNNADEPGVVAAPQYPYQPNNPYNPYNPYPQNPQLPQNPSQQGFDPNYPLTMQCAQRGGTPIYTGQIELCRISSPLAAQKYSSVLPVVNTNGVSSDPFVITSAQPGDRITISSISGNYKNASGTKIDAKNTSYGAMLSINGNIIPIGQGVTTTVEQTPVLIGYNTDVPSTPTAPSSGWTWNWNTSSSWSLSFSGSIQRCIAINNQLYPCP